MPVLLLTDSHTGEAIFSLVNDVAQKEFFLVDKSDAVATDNDANFVKAIELMLSSNATEEHVRCACQHVTAFYQNSS